MKRMRCSEQYARIVYMGSIAALMLGGFFLEWLVKDGGLWRSAGAVLLPALPAAMVYALESGTNLLDRSPNILKGKWYIAVAAPFVLVCWGLLLQEDLHNRNLYWSLGYLLCCYVTFTAVPGAAGVRCSIFLAQTALFGCLSIWENVYAGGSIAIAVLSVFLLFQMAYGQQEEAVLLPVFFLALVSMVLCGVGPVLTRLLYSAVSQETDIVLADCRNLLPFVRAFGRTALPFGEYDGLMFGHQLGYLLARLGWVAAIPPGLAAVAMVISGFRLADDGKQLSMLRFGCHMLLVLRMVSAVLILSGVYMGLCGDVPFLGGSFLQRAADCLLGVVVLLPSAKVQLENLDPEDPDIEARERSALEELRCDRTGLASLCRYVYDNPNTPQGWSCLTGKFRDVMDPNDIAIMARYGRSVLSEEDFRRVFAGLAPSDTEQEDTLPEVQREFSADGMFLIRYMGFREKLVIPPFWLIVEEGAAAENPFLKAISVPNTVLRIDENAFRNCTALEQVRLRPGLLVLGDHVFCGTGLKQIRLPSGLRRMGRGCFQNTALDSVEIPGTVRVIPEDCFADNPRLEHVVLEEGVQEIGPGAFRGCSALRSIRIPESIRFIHPSAFTGCTALEHIDTAEGWKERSVEPLLPVLFAAKEKEEIT